MIPKPSTLEKKTKNAEAVDPFIHPPLGSHERWHQVSRTNHTNTNKAKRCHSKIP